MLAMYLLGLSVVPCADGRSVAEGDPQELVATPYHHGASHSDICQPLCSCSCCGTHTTVARYEFLHIPESSGSSQFLFRAGSLISHDRLGVWQPPRLI